MRRNKHLDFYMTYAESGILPETYFTIMSAFFPCGLCKLAAEGKLDNSLLNLFYPTPLDEKWLEWEGHDVAYWGSESLYTKVGVFTPLRQTIVLFMAAMNDEL